MQGGIHVNAFYLAPPLFFAIAFVFSMLGMGGSQLYISILFWMGMDFKTEAVPLGMSDHRQGCDPGLKPVPSFLTRGSGSAIVTLG
jgi:hypothetical protein